MTDFPWNDPDRGQSALLTQAQREALLSDERLTGSAGSQMRGRIKDRIKHTLYDFVVLNRHMREKDLLDIFESDTDVFEHSSPNDETSITAYQSALSGENGSDIPANQMLAFAMRSAERLLYEAIEEIESQTGAVDIEELMNDLNSPDRFVPKSHPYMIDGIADNHAEARKLEAYSVQMMLMLDFLAQDEQENEDEFQTFKENAPENDFEALTIMLPDPPNSEADSDT